MSNEHKTSNILISIVIPTYNQAQYLRRAIESILGQSYSNWEAIIVDNHSVDSTLEVLKSFNDPRINYLQIHNNGVIASSRNLAIKKAMGEWIAFLDSDDWWTADKLQICINHINDDVDLIHHNMKIHYSEKILFKRQLLNNRQLKTPVLMDLLINGNLVCNSSVLVRKKILKNIGYLAESQELVAAEDYHAWLRIAQISDKFLFISKVLGYYFINPKAQSRRDMSIPTRNAIANFLFLLDSKNLKKVENRLQLTSMRASYSSGDYFHLIKSFFGLLKNSNWSTLLRFLQITVVNAANKFYSLLAK